MKQSAALLFYLSSCFAFAFCLVTANVDVRRPDAENWCIGGNGMVICGSARVAGAIDYLAW